MKNLLKTVAVIAAIGLSTSGAFAQNRVVRSGPSPVVQGIVVGAVAGALVGSVMCGPAYAACAVGSMALTSGTGILAGAAIGGVLGGTTAVVFYGPN